MTGKWAVILAVAAAVGGGATSASATALTTTYSFNSCHIQGGCGDLPYGQVTLTENMGNVNVSVSGPNFVEFAGSGAIQGAPAMQNVIFAFNGTGITATDIVNETSTDPPPPVVLTGIAGTFSVNGQPDFGTFGFGIACSCNGTSQDITKIDFTVLNATIADLTAPNGALVLFIADVLVNGTTGVIDVSVPGPIVGAGLPGLVLACGGLLGLARRRRERIA
jgi:hypothetical protein